MLYTHKDIVHFIFRSANTLNSIHNVELDHTVEDLDLQLKIHSGESIRGTLLWQTLMVNVEPRLSIKLSKYIEMLEIKDLNLMSFDSDTGSCSIDQENVSIVTTLL